MTRLGGGDGAVLNAFGNTNANGRDGADRLVYQVVARLPLNGGFVIENSIMQCQNIVSDEQNTLSDIEMIRSCESTMRRDGRLQEPLTLES